MLLTRSLDKTSQHIQVLTLYESEIIICHTAKAYKATERAGQWKKSFGSPPSFNIYLFLISICIWPKLPGVL